MNLNQVTIGAFDIEKSIEFYKLLGLQLIVHSSNHYARFECIDGKSTFSISKLQEGTQISSTTKIYFECESLEEKVKALKSSGIPFLTELKDQSWLWKEIKLLDPSGNEIILYYAGDNRLNPPWRIK